MIHRSICKLWKAEYHSSKRELVIDDCSIVNFVYILAFLVSIISSFALHLSLYIAIPLFSTTESCVVSKFFASFVVYRVHYKNYPNHLYFSRSLLTFKENEPTIKDLAATLSYSQHDFRNPDPQLNLPQ